MLKVNNLKVGYGDIIAVHDLSFTIGKGKILALMGANGAGKSSTLMSLMGLSELKSGQITMEDVDISNASIESRISTGLSIVPEGRRIFSDLTIKENLIVGGHIISKSALESGLDMVYEYFPKLGVRKNQLAGSLSGGEQQMLAMGRGLISQPKLLIVDELSLGLMPKIVDECYIVIDRLRKDGMSILLVEQNTERAISVADDVCVLEAGNLVWSGKAVDALNNTNLKDTLMGLH